MELLITLKGVSNSNRKGRLDRIEEGWIVKRIVKRKEEMKRKSIIKSKKTRVRLFRNKMKEVNNTSNSSSSLNLEEEEEIIELKTTMKRIKIKAFQDNSLFRQREIDNQKELLPIRNHLRKNQMRTIMMDIGETANL